MPSLSRTPQLAVLGGLACVMIAVYARALWPRPSTSGDAVIQEAERPAEIPTSPAASVFDPAQTQQRQAQRLEAQGSRWGRDPFLRGATTGELSGLSLSGILWSERSPIAIINGQMVRVGEEIEGYRILEISQNHVAVSDGVDTIRLSLAP